MNYALFGAYWNRGESDSFGWHDLDSIHNTKEDAIEFAKIKYKRDDWHVVDLLSRKIVAEG